jgi:integrative and conjugative element protein (TIGR02256 family)
VPTRLPSVRMSGELWLDEHARALIEHEAAKHPRRETGGALFGYEQDDHLVVACAYGPGPRAKHRRASFEPHPATTSLLMDAVRGASEARYRYLGSWHTHPGGPARPSGQDIATTESVAHEPDVLLDRPLLLIQATRPRGRAAEMDDLRAWRWDPDATWVAPLPIELCRLSERYCPVVTMPSGRRRRPSARV